MIVDQRRRRKTNAQGAHVIPVRERSAFLRVLAWLAARDRKIAPAERRFLRDAARDLGLPGRAVDAALARAWTADPETAVRGLRTEWVKRALLHRLLLLAISDGEYDARERAGLFALASLLGVAHHEVELLEEGVASDLKAAADVDAKAGSARQSGASGWTWKRIAVVGGVTVGAAALLVITGGAAAPAIGGAIGSTFMGLSGAAATSAGLAALGGGAVAAGGFGMAGGTVVVAGGLGLMGGGFAGAGMAKRTADLAEFDFVPLGGTGTHVVIAVSGFLSQQSDFVSDWAALKEIFPRSNRFALRWESQALMKLGSALGVATGKAGAGVAARAAARQAARAAAEAVALPAAILTALGLIDNPWHVAHDRAVKAGQALAHCLESRAWGKRPVTLVGFSLGARVIAEALHQLGPNASALVHDAVLIGGAVPASDPIVQSAPRGIAGSLVNVHCDSDWVLAYLFRAAQWKTAIGTQAIDHAGVTNVDVSDLVTGHLAYRTKLYDVLERVRRAIS
ncbi:MAG TPA: DUF726 domain-containing protein [Polyangiaceae bacterium]|jgi:DnaJ-domain-containing protein 1